MLDGVLIPGAVRVLYRGQIQEELFHPQELKEGHTLGKVDCPVECLPTPQSNSNSSLYEVGRSPGEGTVCHLCVFPFGVTAPTEDPTIKDEPELPFLMAPGGRCRS